MTFTELKKVLDNDLFYWVAYYSEETSPEGIAPEWETKNTMPAWMLFCDVKNIYEDAESGLVIVLKENTVAKVIRETIETYKTEV